MSTQAELLDSGSDAEMDDENQKDNQFDGVGTGP